MKNKTKKSENKQVDAYNSWDENRIEFVTPRDEDEALQSLGVSVHKNKSVYNQGFDTYFD